MKIETLVPGATFNATTGAFTISFANMNAQLTTTMSSGNSAEKLIFGLLEIVYQRQKDGFLTQPTISMEVSNRASQQSVWEEGPSVFSNADLLSHLVSFNFDSGPSFNGDNIHPTTS